VIAGLDKKLEREKRKGSDGKAIKEDITLSRLEVEKKFACKGGSFFKTV